MRRHAPVALCCIAVALLAGLPADAATSAPEPSLFARAFVWVFEQQRLFHRELTSGLRALTTGGGAHAGWGLILASFLYGILHAAGPGHGKAILTTYLLTHRERVARGVWLAALAAACQGAMAILLVYGLIEIAGWLPREASGAAVWSERASYVLVVLVGAMLTVRALRALIARFRAVPHELRDTSLRSENMEFAGFGINFRHHGDDCGCGHAHAPSLAQIEGARGFRTTLGLVLSIGLRPCSGALLVLVFASIAGIAWAGIAAVVAMSVGTALAVAGLALLAVGARRWAASIAGSGSARYRAAGDLVALLGGAAVAAIGISLLAASLAPSHPLGLG